MRRSLLDFVKARSSRGKQDQKSGNPHEPGERFGVQPLGCFWLSLCGRTARTLKDAHRTQQRLGASSRSGAIDRTPSGFMHVSSPTQGSSFLATLGWRTQSLWACETLSAYTSIQERKFGDWNLTF